MCSCKELIYLHDAELAGRQWRGLFFGQLAGLKGSSEATNLARGRQWPRRNSNQEIEHPKRQAPPMKVISSIFRMSVRPTVRRGGGAVNEETSAKMLESLFRADLRRYYSLGKT